MPDFSKLKLPFWMNKGELAKLLTACKKFWQWLYDWLLWPSKQFDPLVCPEPLLALLAWERDITRFNGEPLDLFRKRVAYAWINARDAGSVEGFIAIFHRLGIGYVELQERQAGKDWDVITIRVSDGQIAANGALLLEIIRQYGRACRRYDYEVITIDELDVRAGWFTGDYVVYTASK
ncbi:hypothetical protein GJV07_00635 [Enterobacteriaceae bacterium RIT711]|nr:hypothetical protein [Enterobacteriaceae bacterium RIT711]